MKNTKLIAPESASLRQKVEKQLKKSYGKKPAPLFEADTVTLLHELQVYQIELEMQNDELRLAKENAEHEAEQYANLYEEIYDFAPAGYVRLNRDGTIYELNLSCAKLLGEERSGLVNKKFELFVTRETLPIFHNFLQKIFETNYKQTCEVRLTVKELPSIDVLFEGIISEKKQKCLVTAIDITDRKLAEEALRESEKRYRQLVEQSPNGIAIYQEGLFVYVNPAGTNILGAKNQQELIGKPVLSIVHPESRDEIIERMKLVATGIAVPPMEVKLIRLNGGAFDAEVITLNTTCCDKPAIQIIVKDITDRKQAEEILRESEARLHKLNATKDKLFSIIAHDLRSPFNSILGFSGLLCSNIRSYDIEKSEQCIEQINSSAKHTFILLDNLLTWAQTQTGIINFKPENLNLRPILQEIIDLLNSSARIKNISLTNFQADDIVIYADLNMLQTILRNLISNAIKFTNSNGNIDIYAISSQDQVEITVEDNGVGMNEETRNKLFTMDTNLTTVGTANEKGSGLGLLLCYEFVEKHRGKIWVESETGKGSKFHFSLPKKEKVIS